MTLTPRTTSARARRRRRLNDFAAKPRVRCGACWLAAIGVMVLAGCYSPMYSQRYGQPYGQPVYPGTMQPGGQYYPGVQPGATLGPTFDPNTPVPDSGGNAPLYGTQNSTQNRPVPDYSDGQYYPPSGGAAGDTTGGSNPFGSSGQLDDGGFQPPVTPGNPGNFGEISLSREVRNFGSEEYGYDAAGYRWLQGVVSYDPRDKSWGIVYSDNPSNTDPYTGYLTLVDDPRLAQLKDGDIVRLEGQVDQTRLDYSSRPSYAVRQITQLSR